MNIPPFVPLSLLNILLSFALFYCFNSFRSKPLPWETSSPKIYVISFFFSRFLVPVVLFSYYHSKQWKYVLSTFRVKCFSRMCTCIHFCSLPPILLKFFLNIIFFYIYFFIFFASVKSTYFVSKTTWKYGAFAEVCKIYALVWIVKKSWRIKYKKITKKNTIKL